MVALQMDRNWLELAHRSACPSLSLSVCLSLFLSFSFGPTVSLYLFVSLTWCLSPSLKFSLSHTRIHLSCLTSSIYLSLHHSACHSPSCSIKLNSLYLPLSPSLFSHHTVHPFHICASLSLSLSLSVSLSLCLHKQPYKSVDIM